MKQTLLKYNLILCLVFSLFFTSKASDNYDNFNVAIYCTISDVIKMADEAYLEQSVNLIEKSFKIDKVYLETHRRHTLINADTLSMVKRFFEKRGIATSGGITTTSRNSAFTGFNLFCYSNEQEKDYLKEVTKFTAKHFDEVIFDDFYFTTCTCEKCVQSKGNKSWADYRLQIKRDFSREVVKAAKAVNPKVNMIIKYPNWYEYYQDTGYNLKDESAIFDMIYTGTETRDPEYHQQHLQPYHGYSIMRYLENVKPGLNGGGWVDPGARRYLDRYGEQLALTLFAKSKEITLFNFGSLTEWIHKSQKEYKAISSIAPTAGYVFDKVDCFADKLGSPVGLACYRPFHSSGESYLHSYLGMLGIPIELTPEFPSEEKTILLTESAKKDENIISKIKKHLTEGKNIIITSGLLRALQDEGLNDIVGARYGSSKIISNAFTDLKFSNIYKSDKEIIFPEIEFSTNNAWKSICAMSNGNSYPLLLNASYGKGKISVLTIPDNFADLYDIPEETLSKIKGYLLNDFEIKLESPGKVALFLYDNNSFIIYSFLPYRTDVSIVIKQTKGKLVDLLSNKELNVIEDGSSSSYKTSLGANSYKVFKWE